MWEKYKEVMSLAYFITDDCISCTLCEAECPTNAISAGDGKFVIDAATCLGEECGLCAKSCPVEAIELAK